jgi:putative pyridoxal-dependent aspartate 1-decarboxylase
MSDSNLETFIRQHFSVDTLQADPALLERMLTMLQGWLTPENGAPYPSMPFDELMHSFGDYSMPEQGMSIEPFLNELTTTVLSNTARLNHPMFIGHMTQALPWMSVVIEAFTAVLNQNQVKIETAYASTLIEKQILGWMHRKVYGCEDQFYADAIRAKSQAVGNIVNGGTMGNLTALAVALEHQLPGSRKKGLYATLAESGHRGLAVIGSARVHYSLKKAVATLGLGENSLHLIPVDQDNRLDLSLLEAKIDALKQERIKIVALIGIAGTTETGAIDSLMEVASIARREQTWFHVDAAWGGALLLAEQFRPFYQGIELADSVAIDGHKLFWVPMAQGMVLFKDQASLDCLKHNANYIIRTNSGDLGQTSLEGSRRFDALKLWASFKIFGVAGYSTLLTQAASLTSAMRRLLEDQQDFELTSDSNTFILTYRFMPGNVRRSMAELIGLGKLDEAIGLNQKINQLNATLQDRQKMNGKSFVSRTALELQPFPDGITVLRVVLTNVTTTPAHLRAILQEQRQIGEMLMKGLQLLESSLLAKQ